MDKENVKAWSSCLLWIVGILLLYIGCDWYTTHQNEKERAARVEKERRDSIRKAFIADSLAHDPHYQDSLRKEEERFQIWHDSVKIVVNKTIAGVMLIDDSVYHTCFHDLLTTDDINRLRFVSNKDVDDKGYEQCDICWSLDLEAQLDDGEILYRKNARDYDLIPIEDAGKYCNHEIDY